MKTDVMMYFKDLRRWFKAEGVEVWKTKKAAIRHSFYWQPVIAIYNPMNVRVGYAIRDGEKIYFKDGEVRDIA